MSLLLARIAAAHRSLSFDDFSANTLANYTQYADTTANWSIDVGLLKASSGSQSILTRNGVSFADGTISAVLQAANDAGLALRVASASTYYLATIADSLSTSGSSNVIKLYKRVGGSFTLLGSGAISFLNGTSHTLAFSATGSSLVVKFDGATIVTATDTGITAAGLCGPRAHGGSSGQNWFDRFTWG